MDRKRKARAHNSKLAPRRGQAEARQAHEETPLPVERVSKYLNEEEAVIENQAEASEDQLERSTGVPPDAAAEVAGAEGASGLAAVGEEVQAVLSSAHDAAAAILQLLGVRLDVDHQVAVGLADANHRDGRAATAHCGNNPLNPAAEAARATPVPRWRWAVWWVLLLVAGLLFYFLLAPIWLGLRAAAWVAEFRARRRRSV